MSLPREELPLTPLLTPLLGDDAPRSSRMKKLSKLCTSMEPPSPRPWPPRGAISDIMRKLRNGGGEKSHASCSRLLDRSLLFDRFDERRPSDSDRGGGVVVFVLPPPPPPPVAPSSPAKDSPNSSEPPTKDSPSSEPVACPQLPLTPPP